MKTHTFDGFLKRRISFLQAGWRILAVMGSLSLQAATNETTSFSPIFVKNAAGALRTLTWSYVVNGGQPIRVPDDDPSVSEVLITNFVFKCSDINLTINPTAKTRDVQFSATLSGNALEEESEGSFRLTGTASVKATENLETLEDEIRVKKQRMVMGFNLTAAGQGSMAVAVNLFSQFDPSAEWFLDRSDLDQFDIGYVWFGDCQGSTTGSVKVTVSGVGSETTPIDVEGSVSDQWTVVDKLERFTVGALTYKNVVVVERQTEVPTGGMTGDSEPATITYWVAQGVGMVKGIGQYQFMGTPLTLELKSATLVLPKLPQTQTITFPVIPVKQIGAVFDPLATASSKLPVSYVSSNEAVAIVTAEGMIEVVGLGTTTITAYQDGNDDFKTAVPVSKVLTVKTMITANVEPLLGGTVTGGGFYSPGQNVTLTAAPKAGFAFLNWTDADGNVVGTNKVKIVTITEDVAFTANFIDTAKPTVAIMAPTALQKIFGATGNFTVTGTALDNLALSNVMVSVNGASPVPASTTTNGWKNWSLPVTLLSSAVGATNTIAAYSRDTTGNTSATVTVKCVYTEIGTLNIITNGPGKVTVAPIGPLLLNKTYTLTAAANAGGVFASWAGDASGTNKAAFVTLTSSNTTKTVTANFTDTAKPTVVITYPANNLKIMTNGLVTIRGTVMDNDVLKEVKYQLYNGTWTNAVSTNGLFKTWTADYVPAAGLNTSKVYSVDMQGNYSTTSTVVFTYIPGAILTVQTNTSAGGTITPSLNGKVLQIGSTNTMTAAPKAGCVFLNWTYGGGLLATNTSVIKFVMTNGMALTANFSTLLDLSEEGLSALSELLDTNSIPQGDSQLIVDAATAFDLAARSNPNNYTNRIYNAVTIIMNLINNQAVRSQMHAYGVNLDNLLDPTCIFPTNAPSVDASVDQFAAVVFPAIDKAWAELNAVPATWAGMVEISTNRFPSFDESVYIDVGDVAALKAALKGLRAFTGVLKAYNLNVNYNRIFDPVVTQQKAITVDGSAADWTNVPRSLVTFAYEDGMGTAFTVTQEVAVALDGTNVALLVTGCPFEISDNFLIDFDLNLSDGDAINTNREHYIRLGPLASVIYGRDNDIGMVGLEASLVDGVLEVKFPVQDGQATSQVTISEVGCAMDFGGYWEDIFWIDPPGDTLISTLRASHPEFFSRVRNQTSLTAAKTDLQAALNGYLAADMLIGKRSTNDVSLHLVDFDPLDEVAEEDRAEKRDVVSKMLASLAASVQLEGDEDIEGTWTRPVFLGALFNGKITTNMLPLSLKGTLNNPDWTVFPDPTLSGLLPGMTATNLNKYMRGYTWADVETTRDFSIGADDPYALEFCVATERENMAITNVTVSGSGVLLRSLEPWWDDEWGCDVPSSALAVGTPYTFTVYFADGSREVIIRKINAWVTVDPKPVLTGTVLRWSSGAAVPNADHYSVDTSYGYWDELPLTQTSIDLSEFGYVAGDPCWFDVEIVNKNGDRAYRSVDYQGITE